MRNEAQNGALADRSTSGNGPAQGLLAASLRRMSPIALASLASARQRAGTGCRLVIGHIGDDARSADSLRSTTASRDERNRNRACADRLDTGGPRSSTSLARTSAGVVVTFGRLGRLQWMKRLCLSEARLRYVVEGRPLDAVTEAA